MNSSWTNTVKYHAGSEILPHHVNYFIIQAVRCIKAPDEIQMFPFWNVFVVNQVCDLSEQHRSILCVCQPVMSTSPHRGRHSHLLYFVERGSRLRRGKGKTKALERTSLHCDTAPQCNIRPNARRMCQVHIFSSSLGQLDMESWLNRNCNSKSLWYYSIPSSKDVAWEVYKTSAQQKSQRIHPMD